jgi:hypothetical protein
VKSLVISLNAVVSVGLAATGLTHMLQRDPLAGGGHEYATLMWIAGLVSLFLIPLEICLIKTPGRDE